MSHFAKITGVTMVLLGVLAPIVAISTSHMGDHVIDIQSLFWHIKVGAFCLSFQFFPFFDIFSTIFLMSPLLVLRMVPPPVMVRYYHGKTTRRRALIGIMFGDNLFLALGIPTLLLMGILMNPSPTFPFPVQMLVGFFVLWRFPIRVPIKPWEGSKEAKLWWEKESGDTPESSDAKDEENILR
jgi:hypothetical protein